MEYLGQVILNYRLVRKIGEGGFGSVFLAEHIDLGRRAACKILHVEYARKQELVDRFFREAKAVCSINHPAIIDIQNFGRLPSGEPFYMMEYFPGQDLSAFARDGRGIALPELIAIFDAIAGALSAAHRARVVHRDLKPENIMVARTDGRIDVRLLDFGIAKLLDASAASSSRTGLAMGTPTFMAPEQARDAKNVDQRADVYGFAATLYSIIAGRPLFPSDNLTDVIIAVQRQMPTPLWTLVPGIGQPLSDAVDACLAKDPAARPATIEAAWGTLRPLLSPAAPTIVAAMLSPAMSTPPPISSAPMLTTLSSSTASIEQRPPARRRWLLPVLGLSVAVLTAFVVALVARDRSKSTSGSTEAVAATAEGTTTPVPAPATTSPATTPTTMTPAPTAPSATPAPSATSPTPASPPSATPPTPAQPAPATTPPPAAPPPATAKRKPREEAKEAKVAKELKLKPVTDCTAKSFAAIYDTPEPAPNAVRDALSRLKTCKASGSIDEAAYATTQKKLVERL